MKKKPAPFIALATVFISYSAVMQAQFFKNVITNVKQTAQSRADSKASQATNKALDQLDSAVSGTTFKKTQPKKNDNEAEPDTVATGTVIHAINKAANENPADTSPADLVMKVWGNLAGDILSAAATILSDTGLSSLGDASDPAAKTAQEAFKKFRNGIGLSPAAPDSIKKAAEQLGERRKN